MNWNKFPDAMPPEHVKLLIIDSSASPIEYNIAEYSLHNGWQFKKWSSDDMYVLYWTHLPEIPEGVKKYARCEDDEDKE